MAAVNRTPTTSASGRKRTLQYIRYRPRADSHRISNTVDMPDITSSYSRETLVQMPRYSQQYIANLIGQHDYEALVDLQRAASGSTLYDTRHPSFGWPCAIFVIFELVTWIAQADRSGVWTYYEATPFARMNCVLATLETLGAVELHQQYAYGRKHWQDEDACDKLDPWIRENEPAIIDWAFEVLKSHPAELAAVCD